MTDTITIIDDRTGKQITVPIDDGVFPSSALRELDPDLRMYDPAFLSTAACSSAVTYLDGDAGILRYRGYPIEQLAEHSTYLEVAYLLLNGELPHRGAAPDVDVRGHPPHLPARQRAQAVHGGLPLRRPPDGDVRLGPGRHVDLLPRGQGHLRRGHPGQAGPAAHRQDADPGRVLPSLQHRDADRLPRQRALLHGELPQHDLPGRRRLRGVAGPGPRPRRPLHPPRRPRAELRHHRHAGRGLGPRRPVHRLLGRGVRALRTAPRRCQRGRRAHARRDRIGRQRPGRSSRTSRPARAG